MKIQFLYADTIEQTDQLKKESFGIAVGTNNFMQYIEIAEQEFYDLMKELNKERSIIKQETAHFGAFMKRVKFYVESKN